MKSFKEYLTESFLKTKKIAPQIYQIKGLNVFIDGQEERGSWKMKVGDNIHDAEWIETFVSVKDAINWLEKNPKFASKNGIKPI